MRRFGFFSFILALLSISAMYIVPDEGGGDAGAGDGNSDDNDDDAGAGDGNSDDDAGAGDGDSDDNDDDDGATLTQDEIKEFRAMKAEREESSRLSQAEKSIKSRVPGFDISRVVAGIRELHKKDPQKAAYYNSGEVGLEKYWEDNLANVAKSDEHNHSSNGGRAGDFDAVLDKAKNSGDKKSVRDALDGSKA